jgi:galactose mutarotase-like enzyme
MNSMAKSSGTHQCIRSEHGFAVYVLRNQNVEVAAVPELGGRIISLKNLQTGREWMSHPPEGLKLFRNRPGDRFSQSPLVGMDECLPTIAPCQWQGRTLPDHGELWNAAWSVDNDAWKNGSFSASVSLEISPFAFRRTIELNDNEVRLEYRLSNRSDVEEVFLWAMHPLIALRPGDRLVLPASTRALLNDEAWIEDLDLAVPKGKCSKLFACPLSEGFTAIHNLAADECLELIWSADENNAVGLWLTRGGWHGHHHFAIEPSNAASETLTAAAAGKGCRAVAPGALVTWQVRFRMSP